MAGELKMDVREKLVEVERAAEWFEKRAENTPMPMARKMFELAGEALREKANGVTVQEWIPVSDPPKEKGKYLVLNEYGLIYSADYCNIHKGFGDWFDDIDGDWGYFSQDMGVTHWMPLPQPPKGE